MSDDLPDDIEVHIQVTVDQPVARSGDLLPRDLRIAATGLPSDVLRCLPDDLQKPNHCQHQLLVGIEIRPRAAPRERDRLTGGITHVAEPYLSGGIEYLRALHYLVPKVPAEILRRAQVYLPS